MSDLNQDRSNSVLIAGLAALVACEVVVLGSDLSNGVRYGVGGGIALAMVAGVFRLSQNRRKD